MSTRIWTDQAARDGLHPVVIGFVWANPKSLRAHPPGAWDAVSDCFKGGRLHPRAAGKLLGWSKDASDFLMFARLCEDLPSADSALSGRSRFPVSGALCVVLAAAVLQSLEERARRGDGSVGGQARDFLERALDRMPPEAAAVAARMGLRCHDIPVADRELVIDRAAAVLGEPLERR